MVLNEGSRTTFVNSRQLVVVACSLAGLAAAQSWVLTSAPTPNWISSLAAGSYLAAVASSADGTKLIVGIA